MSADPADTAQRDLRFFPVDNDRPRCLTAAQISRFNEHGYLKPFRIFDQAEADSNRRFFDGALAELLEAGDGRDAFSIMNCHIDCRRLFDVVIHPAVLDIVEDLLGPNFVSWGTHYFCKLPGDVREVSWHQDAPYWPLTPSKTLTVWLAIDDADVANGCMHVIPGSHRHGPLDRQESNAEDHNVLAQKVVDAEQYGRPTPIDLRAGEISLHSDMLIHGSAPNRSQRRRCGLTIRYAPVDVRGPWNGKSVICRGADPSGHWANIDRPAGDDSPPL